MQSLDHPRGATEGEEHLNPLLPHPIEIVLSLVVFGSALPRVKKYVVPSFEKTFAERTEAIEGGLAAAEAKQAEADAKLAELEQQLGEARHEAARIREEAREQGAAIVAEMREQAQAESARIVEHGKAQIEAERQQAVTSLRAEVGSAGDGAGRPHRRGEPRGRRRGPTASSSGSSPTSRRSRPPGATRTGPADGAARTVGRGPVHPGAAAGGRGRDRRDPARRHRSARTCSGWPRCCAASPSLRRVAHRRLDRSRPRPRGPGARGLRRTRSTAIALDAGRRGGRGSAGRPAATSPTRSSTSAWSPSCAPPATTPSRLADELFAVGQVVNDNPELRDALSRPGPRRSTDKRALLDGLLEGKALAATVAAGRAVAGRHLPHRRGGDRGLPEGRRRRARRAGRHRAGRPRRSPRPSRPGSSAALTAQYGREVHLNVVVDPGVIGGIRVEIGDDVIDGTVVSRLDDARRKLAG